MKKTLNILVFVFTIIFTCKSQTLRTVQYDPTTGNIVQENLTLTKIKNSSFPMHISGNKTNIVLSWKTNYHYATPSNNFVISFSDTPADANTVKKITLELVNTNSTLGFFPSNSKELDGSNPILGTSPSTNMYSFYFSNSKFWTESYQNYRTGTGNTNVHNISPSLFDLRIPESNAESNKVWTCTNAVTGEGEWRIRPRTGIWKTLAIPAGALLTNVTDGALFGTEETITNKKRRDYMEFTNATTVQSVCASIPMPNAWDKGNVEVKVYWSATNIVSSQSVVWGIAGDTIEHDEPVDQAYGTEVSVISPQTAFNDLIKSPSTGVLSLGHTASGQTAILDLRIRRLINHASDGMEGVAKIYYIVIRYLESSTEPLEGDTW